MREESEGEDAFEAAVRTVRDVFFPDRTDLDHWAYRRFEGMCGAAGLCNREEAVIFILEGVRGTLLLVLLIHETAHALSSGYHGEDWKATMGEAVKTAGDQGFQDLARALAVELDRYRDRRV